MERFESTQAPANNGSALADFAYSKDTSAPGPASQTSTDERTFTYGKDAKAPGGNHDVQVLPDLLLSNDPSTGVATEDTRGNGAIMFFHEKPRDLLLGNDPSTGVATEDTRGNGAIMYFHDNPRDLPFHPNAIPDQLPEMKGPKEYPGLGNSTLPLPEVTERSEPNFCDPELLKSSPADLNRVRRDEPAGIGEWNITGRGINYANQALGNDPRDSASEQKLNEWLNKTSSEIDVELRQLYNLPQDATKIEVARAMLGDGGRGGRYCAMSQGLTTSDELYDAITRDVITSMLSKQYQQRAGRTN